ncbi:hypothetical protein BDW22DRAFT_338148 [Trametopsis cervina]|nr:hypothetical protein BDW22DRAFT_338148 [Trametopsis cervina]
MDIIDAIEKGITIIQYLREFIDNVKKAPETLRFLEIQAIGVKTLLDELYYAPPEALIPLAEDRSQLEELSTLVRHHLREIETFIGTVHKKDKAGTLRLRKSVWIRRRISGDDAEQLSSRLVSLRDALQTIAVSTVMRSNKRQEGNHAEILQILRAIGLHTSATRWQQTINPQPVTHVPSGPSSSLRLQCLDGCLCRCHSRATRQVMPEGLVPLFGRLHVSRRLLSALPFAAIPLECNVQSCRRSDSSPRTLTWTLPPWWPSFDLSIFLRRLTVHASIRTPNLVSLHAPLWDLIARSDIEGVRALLISGAASIDDINVWGITVLVYAVRSWFRSPCSQRYEMLRFLAESGADPDLSFAY